MNKQSKYAWLGLLVLPVCLADITTDGSVGSAQTLNGPEYDIPATLGTQQGSNLFHSFGQFNLNQSERAVFSGPDEIKNIL
ncbi:MAG TPA: hypothetical protein EYO58_12920, partial [Flavobacteriales bacterium]|nr:hypothetical protein [Flavobacteriales bacterium]